MTHFDPERRHPRLLVYVVLGLVAAMAVAGCGSDDEVERLEREVARLEAQVQELHTDWTDATKATENCQAAVLAGEDLQSAYGDSLELTIQAVAILEGRDGTPVAAVNAQVAQAADAMSAASETYWPLAGECVPRDRVG